MLKAIICLIGILLLVGIAFAFSTDKKNINWRTVGYGLLLQAGLCALVIYIPAGQALLAWVSEGVGRVFSYAQNGIEFMFGDIGNGNIGFIFAFQVLPAIVFFSSLISVMYYLGITQWFVRIIGGALRSLLKTSAPESFSAASNIFVGQTEAPITVRPFLSGMSRSELFAVMVGGLATVAGGAMAGYIAIGIEIKYLVAASFMAAPGAIAIAKLLVPEQADAKLINSVEELGGIDSDSVNVIDAAARGASSGLVLAVNVGAMLIAFVALIALINGLMGAMGGWLGYPNLTMELVLGYVFSPLAWMLGIPWEEARLAGGFIGQKLVLNEFVAFIELVENGAELSEHSRAVITFALCGFANFSSIAILLGGLGMMAPDRRPEIAQMGMRALLAASIANFISAGFASFFLMLAGTY